MYIDIVFARIVFHISADRRTRDTYVYGEIIRIRCALCDVFNRFGAN